MEQSKPDLPSALTRLLTPANHTNDEQAAILGETLTSLSIFKQLNSSDQEIARICAKKGWSVLGFDYLSPPPLEEFLGRQPGQNTVRDERLSLNGPHAVWDAWLEFGQALSTELNNPTLAETIAALRQWPVERKQKDADPVSNVIPFTRGVRSGS